MVNLNSFKMNLKTAFKDRQKCMNCKEPRIADILVHLRFWKWFY